MSENGRNEPCPCGSGRKYKRCCLDGSTGATAFTGEQRAAALAALDQFRDEILVEEFQEARRTFYEGWEERLDELHGIDDYAPVVSNDVFEMWFYLDHRLAGGDHPVDLALRQPSLGAGERGFLDRLRATTLRLYDVDDLSPGVSVDLRDVSTGSRVRVRERSASRTLSRHALLAARIIDRGPSGQPEIEAGLLHIPELARRGLLEQVREARQRFASENPRGGESGFYRMLAPLLHDCWLSCVLHPPMPELFNTDGEALLLTRVELDVLDAAAAESALDRGSGFERADRSEPAWGWTGSNPRGESISLGRIELVRDRLRLECNSSERGARGRAIIEALAGAALRHRATSHEDIGATLRREHRRRSSGAGVEGVDPEQTSGEVIPAEIQEALTLEAMGRHYHSWLDEPIPALRDQTPRKAAIDPALRPALQELLGQLEGMYQLALKRGAPAYDPSWMRPELGLHDPEASTHPPPLAHERLAAMVSGLAPMCASVGASVRARPGFDDATTTIRPEDVLANLDIQRFLREPRPRTEAPVATGASYPGGGQALDPQLGAQVLELTNFELHRRKTFWVDEGLAYMLAKTDPDVPGSDLRLPFASFALVFTDRHVLSLGERALARPPSSPLAGHFLRVVTVYLSEETPASGRLIRIAVALDALGADPPHLLVYRLAIAAGESLRASLDRLLPPAPLAGPAPDANPVRGLLQVVLNATLYATSAGVEPILREPPRIRRSRPGGQGGAVPFSSESVFYLPGAIDISQVRRLQELERIPSGNSLLHRHMVRGHWRRAARTWKDPRMRWIEPYWKGPDIAAVIERTYRLKP